MTKRLSIYIAAILLVACSNELKSSHTKTSPDFADVSIITTDGTVASHVVYRNDVKGLNFFRCRIDPQGPAIYFDARIMVKQADGKAQPQEMQLYFPMVKDSGKAVQEEWKASDKVQIYGRLAEPKHLNQSLNSNFQGSCLADVTRTGSAFKGHMVCTHFQSDQAALGVFDVQVNDFACTLR